MIRYGLKLWSSNEDLFEHALEQHAAGEFDFVELYSDPSQPPDMEALAILKKIPVAIHSTHSHGFHEFILGTPQLQIWRQVLELADFFASEVIVLHPGRDHTVETFQEALALIDDSRIYVENMSGLDLEMKPMFGQKLEDLARICQSKPICFDFEKAVKAACYQKDDYKKYVRKALDMLQPSYFHISGGEKENPVDEHLDLLKASFDVAWMKDALLSLGRDVSLVFETPKVDGLGGDMENMRYFRAL